MSLCNKLTWDAIRIWRGFPYLVHKFIMKNTAALSCSNIVLQKKNSSVWSNSLSLDNYKGQYGGAESGKGNWVQTREKKFHTIKLTNIPENKTVSEQRWGLGTYLKNGL